jgi:hypothetical protein
MLMQLLQNSGGQYYITNKGGLDNEKTGQHGGLQK